MSEQIINKETVPSEVSTSVSMDDYKKLLDVKETELNKLQVQTSSMSLKITSLQNDLKESTEEQENYKNKTQSLEIEIGDMRKAQPNTLSPAQQVEIEKIKKMSEEMLTKAKGIIFDKTKICKNQELQIEALTQQVTSLKEVLAITKDLLEIRNMEVQHLQEKMDCMGVKISAEKHRHDLMHKKMETMTQLNTDLRGEYEAQLKLFDVLRTQYKLKDDLKKQQQNEPAS